MHVHRQAFGNVRSDCHYLGHGVKMSDFQKGFSSQFLFHRVVEKGLLEATEWRTFSEIPLYPVGTWLIRPRTAAYAHDPQSVERLEERHTSGLRIIWMYICVLGALFVIGAPIMAMIYFSQNPWMKESWWAVFAVLGSIAWAVVGWTILDLRRADLYKANLHQASLPQASLSDVPGGTMREDARRLQEFHPEPALRSALHYAFAHKFLPPYIHSNPRAFLMAVTDPKLAIDPTKYIQARWQMFEQNAGVGQLPTNPLQPGYMIRRVTDLGMDVNSILDRPVAIVRMPIPEAAAQAYFVAVVPVMEGLTPAEWPEDFRVRVFTLEATLDAPRLPGTQAILCEWGADGTHANRGRLLPATADDFLEEVQRQLQAEPAA